jgi:hypothetical protein
MPLSLPGVANIPRRVAQNPIVVIDEYQRLLQESSALKRRRRNQPCEY